MDFRSLTTTNYNVLHLFLPSNHYYSSAVVQYHSSRIIKRRPFLHLKPSSPLHASPDIDVISTHEHSDGSLLFRFGDPSVVADNVEVEASKFTSNENEREGNEGYGVIKVLDGDHKREVIVKKSDRGVERSSGSTEEADDTNSVVVSGQSSASVEENNDSGEKQLEDLNETEFKETEVTSIPPVATENTGDAEEGVDEDLSSVSASAVDKSSEVSGNSITTDDIAEKEIADVTSLESISSKADAVADVPDNEETEVHNEVNTLMEVTSIPGVDIESTEDVEEGVNEDSIPASVSLVDKSSEVENSMTAEEMPGKEIADITSLQSISLEAETVGDEPENDVLEASLELAFTPDVAADAELEKEETELRSEITDDGRESVVSETLSLPPQSEPAISLFEEIEDQNLQDEMQDVITGDGSESNTIDNDVLGVSLVTDVSADSENQKEETEMHNEFDKDGRESVTNEMSTLLPQSEPAEKFEDHDLQDGTQIAIIRDGFKSGASDVVAIETQIPMIGNDNGSDVNDAVATFPAMEAAGDWSVGTEAKPPTSMTATLDEIVEDGNGRDMIQLMPEPTQSEAEPKFDEETGNEIVEESKEDDEAESLMMLNKMPPDLILESERAEEDLDVESNDLVKTLKDEVAELKSTESPSNSPEFLATDFVLSSGAALFPHPSKVLTGGEDAYFISGQTWLGVADGVGRWSLEGTSPGVYAQELMKSCERLISDRNGDPINNPLELLKLGVAETRNPGLSTVLITHIDGQALHVANIGDSGFIVLRRDAVYKRSSPMLHAFHFPLLIEGGDDPSHLAELYRVDLEEEDVIITATDGLLDNVYDQEISSIVFESLAADRKPEEIAVLLAEKAQEKGSSASVRSPFADDAEAVGCAGYTGGKLDDVSVIVSVAHRKSDSQT